MPSAAWSFGTIAEPKPKPVPRTYMGNMCGTRVAGIAPVPGGADDPSLVLSWFIDRYSLADRLRIYAAWKSRGITDVLVSWPDSRSFGQSPDQFIGTCRELSGNGFWPCVMGCAKGIDAPDVPSILAGLLPVLALLMASGVPFRFCVGWELSLWLSPTQVQQLIDALAAVCVPANVMLYVHFQEGYFAFQQDGHVTADFWNLNVGKLTGILHQKDLTWDAPMYQARIVDCLQRFAGQDGFSADSGFGHPFDFIACEITAQPQFNGQCSEAQGNAMGQVALATPGVMGPLGRVVVMGSGNGF